MTGISEGIWNMVTNTFATMLGLMQTINRSNAQGKMISLIRVSMKNTCILVFLA